MNVLKQGVEIGGFGLASEDPEDVEASNRLAAIPADGRSWLDIREDLVAFKSGDFDWRSGRVPIYVYHDNDELLRVSKDAYNLYFSENALGRGAFPSLVRMEEDIVRMCSSLFSAPIDATGSFTSGGTESIFLVIKSARDYHRAKHGSNSRLNIVIPITAHPAFDKAAKYLDVDVVRVPVAADFRCDILSLRDSINECTALIAASAPCYPFGVFDPIWDVSQIALDKGVWFHVDACLGGFLAPFARAEGWPTPEFDFSIPGVASLSADLHKFGFSARGASVILYRSPEFHAHQGFHFDNWPRGSYATATFSGSRPGGAIASAWAVLQYLGHAGYRRLAKKAMSAKERLVIGIEGIRGLKVVTPSELNIVVYESADKRIDINAVAEVLYEKGWYVGRSREPKGIHLAINAVHAPVIDEYLDTLREAVDQVRASGRVGEYDDRTY